MILLELDRPFIQIHSKLSTFRSSIVSLLAIMNWLSGLHFPDP